MYDHKNKSLRAFQSYKLFCSLNFKPGLENKRDIYT